MTSVDGDARQQFVELRMLASGQDRITGTVLGVFDADGKYLGDALVVPHDLERSGAGLRWVIASAAFQEAHGFAADFTMPPGILPPEDGMVCWGAPGVMPPPPASWNHGDPTGYVDCVAYGRFCGTSPGGLPVRGTPAGHALARIGAVRFRNRDFACTPFLTPRNSAGIEATLEGAPCAAVDTFLCGQALAGGPPAATDCFATWVVKGTPSARPVVRCHDGDARCDQGSGTGCVVRAQLCLALPGPRCEPPPVTSVALTARARDEVDRGNETQVTSALAAIGGEIGEARVTFTPGLAASTCTPPFNLFVPLGGRGGRRTRGVRRLTSVTRAGRADHDRLRVICSP